jgi:hypothetical protein
MHVIVQLAPFFNLDRFKHAQQLKVTERIQMLQIRIELELFWVRPRTRA